MAFLVMGCRQKQSLPVVRAKPSNANVNARPSARSIAKHLSMRYKMHPISASIPVQRSIEAFVKPFRRKLKEQMAKVIAKAPRALERTRPESNIGNLIADIALLHMRKNKTPVDVFFTNLGGIRNDLAAGPVTVGAIYECLPFENVLVRVQVKGTLLASIIAMVAKRGGEPLAGIRFQIDRRTKRALQIRIGRKPLKPDKMYFLGTSDYIANTGFLKPFLKGAKLEITRLLLRDSVIWGLQHTRLLRRARKDRRISYRK